MGGTITVNSKEGVFTRFIVTIPVLQFYKKLQIEEEIYNQPADQKPEPLIEEKLDMETVGEH